MKTAVVLMPWYSREHPAPELALLIALLKKKKHSVTVFDVNNEMFNKYYSNRKYWKYITDFNISKERNREFHNEAREIFEYFASRILSTAPDVVVFKILGNNHANSDFLADIIHAKNPGMKIVFSGVNVTRDIEVAPYANRDNVLPYFDYLVCGEDLKALPDVLDAIESGSENPLIDYKKVGNVLNCLGGPLVEDFDGLPYFDYTDFDFASYASPDKCAIFTSKGCPWRCSYCMDWKTQNKYRSMSGRRIFSDLEHQINTHANIRHFRFTDSTINGNIASLNEFCELMINARGSGLREIDWGGDAIIRREMDKPLLQKMRKAGCGGLGFGIESGSQKVLDKMNKHFAVPVAEEVLKNTAEAGIFTSINIIVGFPTETAEDFGRTMEFVSRNRTHIGEVRITHFGCRIPFDSTIYNDPGAYGLAGTEYENWATKDGLNNCEERERRFELLCGNVVSLGIKLMVGGRPQKVRSKEAPQNG